jgi:hypothetical protein
MSQTVKFQCRQGNAFYGWFDDPGQTEPTYEPPRNAPCLFCGFQVLADDVRTHSLTCSVPGSMNWRFTRLPVFRLIVLNRTRVAKVSTTATTVRSKNFSHWLRNCKLPFIVVHHTRKGGSRSIRSIRLAGPWDFPAPPTAYSYWTAIHTA